MSTRGNYVFADIPHIEVDGDWIVDYEALGNLKKSISDDDKIIERGHKIYVHWDNYPSYAIPSLFQFLRLDSAAGRKNDASYLSAWFVAHKTVGLDETFRTDLSFTGCGLENQLNDWCDYTYLILPNFNINKYNQVELRDGFLIYIYDYKLNFIDRIHSDDKLEHLVDFEWWY